MSETNTHLSSSAIQAAPDDAKRNDPRIVACLVVATAATQVILTAAHLPAWTCPLHALTGITCPGCGLSRATVAVCTGHMDDALRLHAFGLLVPPLMLILTVLALLPKHLRMKATEKIMHIERRWHVGLAIGIVFLGYWIVRLCGWLPPAIP